MADTAIGTDSLDDKTNDRLHVTALARGLGILRCFTPKTPELGTSQIARTVGLPQPTVWRLCHTLLQLGFLVHVPGSDKLRLGIPILSLGYAVLTSYPFSELATPYMQDIAERYHGQVSIGAPDGVNMVYLQRRTGSAIVLADLAVGSLVPMAYSATGWAYLAGLDAEERESYFAKFAEGNAERWKNTRPKLEEAISRFDEFGYITSIGVLHPDINAVATPIRSKDGATILAISSGGLSTSFGQKVLEKIGAELVDLSQTLSVALRSDIRTGGVGI